MLAKAVTGLGKAFGKLFTLGGLVVGVLMAIGFAYSKYKQDLEDFEEIGSATDDIVNKIKIDLTKGFDADPITEDQWTNFLSNLQRQLEKQLLKVSKKEKWAKKFLTLLFQVLQSCQKIL